MAIKSLFSYIEKGKHSQLLDKQISQMIDSGTPISLDLENQIKMIGGGERQSNKSAFSGQPSTSMMNTSEKMDLYEEQMQRYESDIRTHISVSQFEDLCCTRLNNN